MKYFGMRLAGDLEVSQIMVSMHRLQESFPASEHLRSLFRTTRAGKLVESGRCIVHLLSSTSISQGLGGSLGAGILAQANSLVRCAVFADRLCCLQSSHSFTD